MTDQNRPSRRQFIKSSAAGAFGVVAGSQAAAQQQRLPGGQPSGRLPNILFIMCDEMRYPPVYEGAGAKRFRRRYLRFQDEIRRHGVEFNRHYAASSACAPSRTSLFTGQYPSLHGVTQTTGAAKSPNDPDTFWLDTNSVPTMGDYFRAAGYRTFYKGKWHVSDADLQIPGTHDQLVSYTQRGIRDPAKERDYLQAQRLSGYGFTGWVGPEPHGKAPLNTGSSPAVGRGRDQSFASQSVELIRRLDRSGSNDPWLMVASFVNPHDITLWGYAARNSGQFDFSVQPLVPDFDQLFDLDMFNQSLSDDLDTKPSVQKNYQETYSEWMQGIPPEDYFRLYYQLQKNVDEDMARVYAALKRSRFFDNTIVVFTSDHGDLLGSHAYLHQKWYQMYDEALRVPLIFSNPHLFPDPVSVDSITSHIDMIPTLLGLAGFDDRNLLRAVSDGHTDAVELVGRDLSDLVLGKVDGVYDPIYFMTDDDPSRGPDQQTQENFYGIPYDSIIQPSHIESVIVKINGDVWKFAHYFDNLQFWTDPAPSNGRPADVIVNFRDTPNLPGTHPLPATKRSKYVMKRPEYEMYNTTQDPMELNNLADSPRYAAMRARLQNLLVQQRQEKRLKPVSGVVPGQPY